MIESSLAKELVSENTLTMANIIAAAGNLGRFELRQLRNAIDRLDMERRAIVLHPAGKSYRLMRLDDGEYFVRYRQSIPIEEDWGFLLRHFLALGQRDSEPTLAQIYLALTELTGPSGSYLDDYKCSFSFPFLLAGPRLPEDKPYLLVVEDIRGSVEFLVRKVLDSDDSRLGPKFSHPPFAEEFPRDGINEFIVCLHSHLAGYWERVRDRPHEPFLKSVPSESILYGYCGGACFEEQYRSERSYHAARKTYESRIKRERKRGRRALPSHRRK